MRIVEQKLNRLKPILNKSTFGGIDRTNPAGNINRHFARSRQQKTLDKLLNERRKNR